MTETQPVQKTKVSGQRNISRKGVPHPVIRNGKKSKISYGLKPLLTIKILKNKSVICNELQSF